MTTATAPVAANSTDEYRPACALCHKSKDMAPSPWGHPSILICHNPPCIYTRALRASRKPVLLQPVEAANNSRDVRVLSAEVLCLAGERTAMSLVSLLSDGATHTADECRAQLGMTTAMLRTTLSRVRRRGFDILTLPRTRFRPLAYELVAFPSLAPERKIA